MTKSPEIPTRTCVGGGGQASQDEMERFVFDERVGLIFDVRKKAPGRGAWLKISAKSLKKACESGFSRAFKTKVPTPAVSELAKSMAEGIQQRLVEHVQAAIRSKSAWTGGPAVEEGMRRDDIELLIVATDAGDATHKKFVSNAERKKVNVLIAFSGEELGRLAGKPRVSVVGIAGPLAGKIEVDVAHLETLNAFEG